MFIDQIMRYSYYPNEEEHNKVKRILGFHAALRFQVDNVARYVHDTNDDRNGRVEDHIPNIAPLAGCMWFEYNGLAIGKSSDENFGCFLSVDYARDENFRAKKYDGVEIPNNVRWILRAEYFYTSNKYIGVSDWVYYFPVDEDGKPLGMGSLANQWLPADHIPDTKWRDVWHEEVIVALTAICFAHCKGAETKEHQPSRQVRRAAERKGEPVYTHKTIDIAPASRVLREEGNVAKNGLGKALHICRGHFAHYTAEKPLFGKYVGTVYKPMHLRGKAENGVAEKDYRVLTEAQ